MAAYSAVACFRSTLNQLLLSNQFPFHFPQPQIESLHEKVSSLQRSLEKIVFVPKKWRIDMNLLQTRIKDAIYAAEDQIEYSITKAVISSQRSADLFFKTLAEDIDLLAREAQSIAEKIGEEPTQNLSTFQPARFSSRGKNTIVGQETDFDTIFELLKSDDKKRLVIPITGLPGLGKTTLARNIYESRQAKHYFNIRAWVTVSQDYNKQDIFSKILSSMESQNYQAGHYATLLDDEETLLYRIQRELYNLKYLIVVDDVWYYRAWDRIALALPDKVNGSRIIVTTRIRQVAESIQKNGYIHTMKPMGLEESWKMLCYKVFDVTDEVDEITDACPLHLRDIGRSIAEKCKGLPLSLTVVGGLLLQGRERVEYWKRIEEDVADALKKGDDSYLEILYLSYSSLPNKLKGCFLYLGAFPEDSEIRVSKLTKLWVAEGFLTLPTPVSQLDPTLEVTARASLDELVGRNLVEIRRRSPDGGMKSCVMHDSLREICEQECRNEKFFHSLKKYSQQLQEDMENPRRVSVHNNLLMSLKEVYDSTKSFTLARSLLYIGPHHQHPLPFCLTFDLLRVLDAFTIYFIRFPHQFLDLVHLTYLALTYNHDLPPKISHLKKLQTLMVRREPKIIFVGASFLPDEIWEMPQLRHLWFTETDFPALPPSPPKIALLLNLQTLAHVDAAYFTDEILDNMPNLKKLAMWIEAPDKLNFNVTRLSKLEHFKFVVLNPVPGKGIVVEAENFFPKTLKRVTLSGCGLPWEYMEYVAENLLDLQVMKLKELAFHGEEWFVDYKFKKLKYLPEFPNMGSKRHPFSKTPKPYSEALL